MFPALICLHHPLLSPLLCGSMLLTTHLQAAQSCTFSADGPFSFESCLMLSTYRCLTITLPPTRSSTVLITFLYHFNLLSFSSTFVIPLIVWSFHDCTGKKLLPSHIWYQKKRNYIPYKTVKSPLRSSLGKFFYRAINQARFTHVLTHIYCERNHDSYSHI